MTTLRIETPEWALPLLQPARYKAAFGGRGSGKSHTFAELMIEAQEDLAEWNRDNPSSPIQINQSQVNRRVQEANKTKAQRLAAAAPKEIRQAVKEELELTR